MNIHTKEATFEHNLKQAVIRMIKDDPQFQGMTVNDAIYHLELGGESLEDYVETNPKQFGQAMASVVFDYLGSDELKNIVMEDRN
jgi:hypothetical protein